MLPRSPTHLAFGRRPQVPCHKTAGLQFIPRVNDLRERARQKPHVFYGLALEVPYIASTVFYWSHKPTVIQCGMGLHKGVNTRRWEMLGFIWRLASTESITLVPTRSSYGSHTLPPALQSTSTLRERQWKGFNFVLTLNYFAWVGSFHPHIMTQKLGLDSECTPVHLKDMEVDWDASCFTILWPLPTFPLKWSVFVISSRCQIDNLK